MRSEREEVGCEGEEGVWRGREECEGGGGGVRRRWVREGVSEN